MRSRGQPPPSRLLNWRSSWGPPPHPQKAPIKTINPGAGHWTRGLSRWEQQLCSLRKLCRGILQQIGGGSGEDPVFLTVLPVLEKAGNRSLALCACFLALVASLPPTGHLGRPTSKTKGNGMAWTRQICPEGGDAARLAHRCPAQSLHTQPAHRQRCVNTHGTLMITSLGVSSLIQYEQL